MAVYISRALAGGDAYVPTNPAQVSFPDVLREYWAYPYVEYARTHSIVTGYPDGSYQPTAALDRGQMAVFIARAMAGGDDNVPNPTCDDATQPFPDVACDFWARRYIQYIVDPSRGVTRGYPDGDYHPEYVCTRDQMAVFVARAFELPR
jgi:hypothetical protein